jgi:hypothetical protein
MKEKKIQFLAAGLKHHHHHHHHLGNNKSWGDFVRIFIHFSHITDSRLFMC